MGCEPTTERASNWEIAVASGLRGILRVRRLRNCPLGSLLIETARGLYVVRRWERTELDLERAAHFLAYMRRRGLPVLVPLSGRSGRHGCSAGHGLWSVHPVKEWRLQALDKDNPGHLAALGEALARYHVAARGYRRRPEMWNAPVRLWRVYAALRPRLPGHLSRAARVLDEEVDYLCTALEATKLPCGPILGELDPERFGFHGNKLCAVLNCEPDCCGPFLFDVAHAVNRFCFSGGKYRVDSFEVLVRAYDGQHPLALVEWDAFPNQLRFSALRKLCTLLRRAFGESREPWGAVEALFEEWLERLRILRREHEGGLGALLVVMATGYNYRRYQRSRANP